MNNPNPLPAEAPRGITPNAPRQLGDDPGEQVPIPNVLVAIESMLRHPRRVMFQLRQPGAGRLIAGMLMVSALCSLTYGVVVGTFSGSTQLWAAPVKISAGLMISAMICLPSLYIFSCLSGSQARLIEVWGSLAGLLMLTTVLLVGFAPVAWVFSQSTESVAWMGALHLIFGLIAAYFGLRFLETSFSHSNARSLSGINTWAIILLVVMLQMLTALRPILGTSDRLLPKEKKFFLSHWEECLESVNKPSK